MNREDALAAFVHGWAITGGPLTERVRAAAREAVEIALESDDVAATIQLGSLAGLWAELYDRREKLTAHHIGEITKAWRALTAHVPVDDMIGRLRRRLDMPVESAEAESGRVVEQAHTGPKSSYSPSELADHYSSSVKYTDAERAAVHQYTGGWYNAVNSFLRTGADPFGGSKDAKTLNKLMGKYTMPADMKVTRVVHDDALPDDLTPGTTFTAKGLQSTAMGDIPNGFKATRNVMKINVPKGMNAIVAPGLVKDPAAENELILPHNTRYEVHSVTTDSDGKRIINVTAHPPVEATRRAGRSTMASTADPNDKRRQQMEAAQAEAESGLHSAITSSASGPEYRAAVEAIASGLKDGEAEGSASGVAMAAEQQGAAVVDFGLAFDDAHTALGNLGDYWGKASTWVARVVDGQATDLGNALARVARDGGDFEAMRDAASEVLDGESIRSVDTIIDMAMSQSFSRGAVSLYMREGLKTVDYVTAGGARVCPRCLDVESENPWDARKVPQPGLHPYCRCVLMPADPLEAIRAMNLDRYTQ